VDRKRQRKKNKTEKRGRRDDLESEDERNEWNDE
jgi:hypothetical protein